MAITEFAREYHEKMFPGYVSAFLETEPEFIERFAITFEEKARKKGRVVVKCGYGLC